MSPEALFSLASTTAAVGWAILILGPRRYAALNAVPLWVLPLALSALYTMLVLSRFSGGGGGFDSLASVATLLGGEWALLAGWVHYLAFDLFVGAVVATRMDHAGIGRIVQGAILATIFMLGPLGLLLAALTEAGLRTRLPSVPAKGPAHVAV